MYAHVQNDVIMIYITTIELDLLEVGIRWVMNALVFSCPLDIFTG